LQLNGKKGRKKFRPFFPDGSLGAEIEMDLWLFLQGFYDFLHFIHKIEAILQIIRNFLHFPFIHRLIFML
jgi:hypothetical protein